MSDFNKKDAAEVTRSTPKQVSKAWHGAREDARASGELTDRPATDPGKNATKEPDLDAYPYNQYPQPKK